MSAPKYDFTAAANLDSALAATLNSLQDLANKRASLRKTDLGIPATPPPSYLWQGTLRTDFETDFTMQQNALHTLIGQLTTIRQQVKQATTAATAARQAYAARQEAT